MTYNIILHIILCTVRVNHSLQQCDRDTVCPNETVLLECFADGPSLVWTLPHNITQEYYQDNKTNVLETYGLISVWLVNSSSTGLLSRLVISYTEELESEIIVCSSLNDNIVTASDTFHYILAQGAWSLQTTYDCT